MALSWKGVRVGCLERMQAARPAMWAAYGWPEDPAETDDETIFARLLALNLERAGA